MAKAEVQDTFTGALIIIGNEILSGRTHDKNLPYLAEELNKIGIRLAETRVIPDIEPACRLSGLEPFNITKDSLFVNVGERCNVTGSARFKRLIVEEDYATALEVALEQVENGAQAIDIDEWPEARVRALEEAGLPTYE